VKSGNARIEESGAVGGRESVLFHWRIGGLGMTANGGKGNA
jgi:hypothetical protein